MLLLKMLYFAQAEQSPTHDPVSWIFSVGICIMICYTYVCISIFSRHRVLLNPCDVTGNTVHQDQRQHWHMPAGRLKAWNTVPAAQRIVSNIHQRERLTRLRWLDLELQRPRYSPALCRKSDQGIVKQLLLQILSNLHWALLFCLQC